jgi:hypothetical protein
MNEESQLDAMRAAIRGDFERLAERRGEQDLMHVREKPAVASAPEQDELPPPQPEPEPEAEAEAEPEPELEPEEVLVAAEEPPRRSWLARLLGL